ncbi:MAG TPA: hypothetical protein VKN73_15105, partial [Desulfosalsimonadaceae bacterium]|nr:hypothetical protein [Desulfosalsimonadaceae bacterium]
ALLMHLRRDQAGACQDKNDCHNKSHGSFHLGPPLDIMGFSVFAAIRDPVSDTAAVVSLLLPGQDRQINQPPLLPQETG